MINSMIGRQAVALVLPLALAGCLHPGEPLAEADPTPSSYQLVDDLCKRVDHTWLTDVAGVPPKFNAIPSALRTGQDHRRCFATAYGKDRRTLIQVQIDTSTPSDGRATLPGSSQPLTGLGYQARIQYGKPIGGPIEQLGGHIVSRTDRVSAAQKAVKVMVTLTVNAPSIPEEATAKAVLTAYATEVFTLLAESQ